MSLVDLMLATGGRMELAYKALLNKGIPEVVQIGSVIASQKAVDYIASVMPQSKTTIWCTAIDSELNEHSYIVPGLGDAGNLCYGDKLD